MKNIQNYKIGFKVAILTAAVGGLAMLGNSAMAQEKGGERLMKLSQRPKAPAAQAAELKTVPMSCSKCQDVVVRVPDWDAKGGQTLMAGGRPTKVVVRHLCEGCKTKLILVGHGKSAELVAKHSCSNCGSEDEACCSTRTGKQQPTPGMEKSK